MNHTDEGTLQSYLDQELTPRDRGAVDGHLARCETCREELARLRSLSAHFSGAMAHLASASAHRRSAGAATQRAGSGSWIRTALPRAAVLILFAGVAASATVPGAPLRQWIVDRVTASAEPVAPVEVTPSAPVVEAGVPVEDASFDAGVSVEAVDGAVAIVLRDAGRELSAQAVFVDGTRAGVYAAGPASASRFETAPGRIEVRNAHSGELRLELPRAVDLITVTVNGREYLRRQEGHLTLRVDSTGSGPREIKFSVVP